MVITPLIVIGVVLVGLDGMGWPVLPLCPPDHVGVGREHGRTCKSRGKAPLVRWKEYQERFPDRAGELARLMGAVSTYATTTLRPPRCRRSSAASSTRPAARRARSCR